MLNVSSIRALLILSVTSGLYACGSDQVTESSQSIARVNQDEITIHQLNLELAQSGRQLTEDNVDSIKPLLDQLINQSVMVQNAVESKLDRDPQVMQAIERAKRQILAQAYMERINASVSEATSEEITQFFNEHPDLFSKRKIYQLNELHLANVPESVDVETMLKGSTSLDAVVSELEKKKISVVRNVVLKSAEQLPTELLGRLTQMSKGQVTAVLSPTGGILVVQLVSAAESPMTQLAAEPYIKAYLANKHRQEASEKEVNRLKELAKVEYLGRFAGIGKSASTAQEKAPSADKGSTTEDAISSGLSGLN